MNSLCSLRIQQIDLLKPGWHNFESMSDNNQKDVLLYGDSRFDENKNFRSYYKLYKKFWKIL